MVHKPAVPRQLQRLVYVVGRARGLGREESSNSERLASDGDVGVLALRKKLRACLRFAYRPQATGQGGRGRREPGWTRLGTRGLEAFRGLLTGLTSNKIKKQPGGCRRDAVQLAGRAIMRTGPSNQDGKEWDEEWTWGSICERSCHWCY